MPFVVVFVCRHGREHITSGNYGYFSQKHLQIPMQNGHNELKRCECAAVAKIWMPLAVRQI